MTDLNYDHLDRIIRFRSDGKGDIVHIKKSDMTVVRREKYSPKHLQRIIKFCERGPNVKYHLLGQFNAAADYLVDDIVGFDITGSDERYITGKINSNPKKKIHRASNQTVSLKKEEGFLMNGRYLVERDGNNLLFTYLEQITAENLNQQYEDSIFSVYVCDN